MAVAAIGAFISIGSSLIGSSRDKAARKRAKKAAAIRQVQQGMANAIMRRDYIRSFRMAQAQTEAAGAAEAGISSSAVMGAQSSQVSQVTSSLDYFSKQAKLDKDFNAYNAAAGAYAQQAATWGAVAQAAPAIAQLGSTIYNSLRPVSSDVQSTPKSTG